MRTDKNTMKWGKNTIKTAKYDETEENDEYVKKTKKNGHIPQLFSKRTY